jgi:hypothetical protein
MLFGAQKKRKKKSLNFAFSGVNRTAKLCSGVSMSPRSHAWLVSLTLLSHGSAASMWKIEYLDEFATGLWKYSWYESSVILGKMSAEKPQLETKVRLSLETL